MSGPMNREQIEVLVILGAALALFISRVRVDLVALLVVLALSISGLATPTEAFAGFGSSVVIMIGSLLVVGEALARTGVADVVGGWIGALGRGDEAKTRAAVILASGVLGSCMNSTAVVALFLPIVTRVAQEHRIAPNRLLMPLAYGSLISGMMTLIGTAPNLIVNAELRARGHAALGFFDFTPIGTAVLLAAIVCFWFAAKWLLPPPPPTRGVARRPRVRDLWAQFVTDEEMSRMRVGALSPLAGKSLRESGLGQRFGVRVVAVQTPPEPKLVEPTRELVLKPGQVLTVASTPGTASLAAHELGLYPLEMGARDVAHLDRDLGVGVVMVHPDSELVGKALADTGFRTKHDLHVAGVRRDGAALSDFAHVPLRAADSLLVMGDWARIARLQSDSRDFVVLTLPQELANVAPERGRMPYALLILLLMILSSAFAILPVSTGALAAAVLLVLTRCVPIAEAYRSIHLSSLVLIAGMLPLADALGRTGVLKMAVEALAAAVGDSSPRVMLALVFVASALVGSIVSNSATAVLMGPIAIGVAEATGLAPQAFAMTVAIAASSAYLTPMASPVTGLVVEPGGYRFGDFLRAGAPLAVATLVITLLLVPLLFPL